MDRVALNQLISGALIDEEAKTLSLAVSDRALVKTIQEVESFAGVDGRIRRCGLQSHPETEQHHDTTI